MTKREALAVARQVGRAPGLRVQGFRIRPVRGGSAYELRCWDEARGEPFTITSRQAWLDRLADALLGG